MGVSITDEGRELINMANKLLNDADHLGDYFSSEKVQQFHPRFQVSSQHYDFVLHAFSEYVNEIHDKYPGYTLGLNQTSTAL